MLMTTISKKKIIFVIFGTVKRKNPHAVGCFCQILDRNVVVLLDTGFSRCHSNPNVYTKKVGNHLIILVIYVDDLINHVKSNLKQNFEMSDLGHFHYFLSLQVLHTKEGIFLSQS